MPDDIGIGLALSGGGYRAMLFNLGSVWRLNELGWLRRIDMITSVSGGSILNGVLATRWSKLVWDENGVAQNFPDVVAAPVRQMASAAIDVAAGVEGLLSIFSTISDKVANAYDKALFHGATLQSAIPEFEKGRSPRFLFYATSLQTGSSVRIERKRLADYRLGEVRNPDLPVARVVAASSAFPPVLSPVRLDLKEEQWTDFPGTSLFGQRAYKRRLLLTDGGVYDNMGLEAIWDRQGCHTVLVSDAGAPLVPNDDPPTDWTQQAIRVLDIVTEQTRALRRRKLLEDLKAGVRKGTYWGIRTQIDNYGLADAITNDNANTAALQSIRTRLNEFNAEEQGTLINWGYALADAGMRRWCAPNLPVAPLWPMPDFPL